MTLPPPPLPPPPPPPRRRWWRLALVTAAFGIALGVAGAYVTVPYYTLGPGPAKDVSELVHVSGKRTYPSAGHFFLTTVSVSTRPVSLFEALVGWIDPSVSLVPRTRIVTPGLTDQQQDQYNALDMEVSKYSALLAALKALDIATPPIPGARVIGVAAGFPAEGKLKKDDLIVKVNDQTVRDPESAVQPIASKPVGTSIRVEVLRDGVRVTAVMRTVRSPDKREKGRPVLGVRLAPAVRLPFDITIDSQNIGGPSAGLAFALTVADTLTPEDLTRGHQVAVTGTIDSQGAVGLVGGVEFKVRAAEREGADVFLAPTQEVAEAQRAASHLKVIGVDTLAEAIVDLRALALEAPKR